MTFKQIFPEKIKKVSKNAEFHADFESVQKVVSKTSLTNMSKRKKSAYFLYVFANNSFFCCIQNFFNGFEISEKFCVFWYP